MDGDDPLGAKRRGFPRWRRYLLFALILFVPVVFLLGNFALTNPWTRGWVCGKIERRTGLEAKMASLTWSPWNGLSMGSFELLQPVALRDATPAPLVHVDRIRLDPVWKSWLRGRSEFSGLSLDSPRIVLPVELLSHLASTGSPQPPAAVVQQPPSIAANETTTGPSPSPGPDMTQPPAPGTPPQPAATRPPATPEAEPTFPVITSPTVRVKVDNASFTLLLASKKLALLEASGITGSIPMAGRPAKAEVKTGTLKVAGNVLSRGFSTHLDWTFPHLTLQPVETTIQGCKSTFAARVSSMVGFPLQAEWRMPPQKPEELRGPLDSRVTMEAAAAEARFLGLLLSPATWQGNLVAEGISPTVTLPSQTTRFDRARMQTILRGGILSCVDARMTGDDASFLGNATLLPDGRFAAAARVVASPEGAAQVAKTLFRDLPGEPSLTPLSTPQRAAFDLEAIGNVGQLFLRLGRDGPVIEFKP